MAPVQLTLRFMLAAALALVATGCGDSGNRVDVAAAASSCMKCHNGSLEHDYAGPGLENPHPFPGADQLRCVTCHGGNPNGTDKDSSHVPPPPEIGDRNNWRNNRTAYFNRLTLTGLDKVADYTAGGRSYTALDYLQFINPGDLRVATQARGCGQCHLPHADKVAGSTLATATGIFSGALYAAGADNKVSQNVGLYENTAADMSFRAVVDPSFQIDPTRFGTVGELIEFPVYSQRQTGPNQIFNNPAYDSANLPQYLEADNRVTTDSPLAHLYHEQVAFTCGDCHLGSAGANNRYGDFRSSGCTACHMPYSLDGKSRSRDPNVNKLEPVDPDDIDPPELAHVRAHRIRSVKRTLPNNQTVEGIDDYTCAGCHQGSNRTVMQYWGIRLDQNQDLRRRHQYPAQPVAFRNTANDTRLFDPAVGNRTFNGRNANQYILFEDYDGDGRDDTPADVHYDAGMGCIDCHGSYDLHGGNVNDPRSNIASRMEHATSIQCVSCHGTADGYAATVQGVDLNGNPAEVAVDDKGNPLAHVVKEPDGHFYMTSKLTGKRHYVVQTRDTVVDSGRRNPFTNTPIYSPKASFAMGRADGNSQTGIGPQQTGAPLSGFSHADTMTCQSCHSAWTNTCMGCHLEGEYNTGNNFSNITGDRIVFREKEADFVYQSPVPFQLAVGADGKIHQTCANTKMFFTWHDRNNTESQTFAFSDRNGQGNTGRFPSLSHNVIMAHSIRGKVTPTDEGPRYCAACHLTNTGLQTYGTQYNAFRAAMANDDFSSLDFNMLRDHIGKNPGNHMESPMWVHMVAGLGSGLFLFDKDGFPVNPLDNDNNRKGGTGTAPAAQFDLNNVVYNLDKIVDATGAETASSNHALRNPAIGPVMRDGARNPRLAGPLGARLIRRLTDPTTGIVLNAWIDADGNLQGDAGNYVR